MKQLWYRFCHWLGARNYFECITVLHRERLPADGPVLYVVLHRNGAVDGLVYRQVLPRAVFLISTQLRRSCFARIFFCGIAVARDKDAEDGNQNEAALRQCSQWLADGGGLIVFPEGTSSLGPRHLPFKSGAARIALDALVRGIPLRIVPLGIHYERAWAFRSKVEVVVGGPISTEFPAELNELGRLREMKRRITTALEAVGANFRSAEAQENAERLAYAATLGTSRSYFAALKLLEAGVPEPLLAAWRALAPQLAARRVLLHQGVPLFPVGPWKRMLTPPPKETPSPRSEARGEGLLSYASQLVWRSTSSPRPSPPLRGGEGVWWRCQDALGPWMLYALLLLGLGPIVLAGALTNFPPLFLGWLAARKFADDLNVIALWRLLIGMPVFAVWFGAVSVSLALSAGWWWLLAYVLLTFAALKSLYRAKKLAVAVWNGLMHRDLAPRAHEFHQSVLETLAHT